MNVRKTVFLLLVAAVGTGSYFGYKMYTQEHISLLNLPVAYHLEAHELMNQFATNEDSANSLYLGQVIEVSGTISEVLNSETGFSILLDGGAWGTIQCAFEEIPKIGPKAGDLVQVRGRCSGYLLDVVLNDCVFTN